jgi:hypothetical protein
MTYSEKLRDPRWQKKRLEILQRDDFTCQLCKDTKAELQIHHKEYITGREPWEYENENFITYCKHCHKVVENYKLIKCAVIAISKRKLENSSFGLISILKQNTDESGTLFSSVDIIENDYYENISLLKESTVNEIITLLNKVRNGE